MSYYQQIINKANNSFELLRKSEHAVNNYRQFHNFVMDFAEAGGKITVEMIHRLRELEAAKDKAAEEYEKAC